MPPMMDVFVLGEPAGSPYEFAEPKWPIALRVIPTGVATLPEFARSSWAGQIGEGDAEFAAIVAGSDRELLRQAFIMTFVFGNDPEDTRAAQLQIERIDPGLLRDPTAFVWQDFHFLLAARAAHGLVVFRRSRFKQIGVMRPVAEPVWDWVIRAALAGNKIDSTPISEDSKSPACRLPLLAPPRPPNEANWLREHLTAFSPSKLHSKPASKVDEIALRAGLFQWHDFLDESHELSQSIEGQGENQLGDYWHAIMHRREPDYSNAKYWFRRIGNQPIYRDLRLYADGVLASCRAADAQLWRERLQPSAKWDPFAFVDMCEHCAQDETSDLALAARRIQYAEMSMLM
jgi:hypothetical protein